jgi:hypothetical protein
MLFSSWLRILRISSAPTCRQTQRQTPRRRGLRLTLEQLEDRLTPSNYTAANVSQLIADINAANMAGGANTITLTDPTNAPYTLAAVDNTTDGATGLPVIAAKDNLTILGNGDTIERSTAAGTPAFRLFDVASGASLTLGKLTLQGGLAYGSGVSAEGGGIYNQGTLDLNGVTVQNNIAQGFSFNNGTWAYGGGVYVAGGAVNLTNDSLLSNIAVGEIGGKVNSIAGSGLGGALYVAGGTVTLTSDTLSSNTARGGSGLGGALYVAGGTVTLTSDTLSSNTARGGYASLYGYGGGGALYVRGGTVTLTNDTLSSNSAYGIFSRAFGGALYVGGGTVTLTSDTLSSNTAQGGSLPY